MAGTALTINKYLQVTAVCRARNQNGLMVWHYKVTNVVGGSVTDQMAVSQIDSNFAPLIKNMLSDQATYEGTAAQIISIIAVGKVGTTQSQGPGLVAGELMSTMTAGEVSLRTALGGRSFRGRKYVPFPGEDDNQASGKPEDNYVVRLALFGAQLEAPEVVANGADSATLTPVVYSRKLGSGTAISDSIARTEWATQRRRSQINRGDAAILI